MLEARDLTYAHAGAPAALFSGVSLTVQPREIVCLLGGSGCGKSTLLRVLAQISPPTAGEVIFLGEPLVAPHPRAALLFQQPSLLPWLSAEANVGFGLDFAHQPRMARGALRARVHKALGAVGLASYASHFPNQLSGGMAQRVALARALAREPRLLLADEPFSALDAITRAEMQTLLVDLVHRWDTATLLVTHDIDEALRVADRILLMGALVVGQPAHLVREWSLSQPRAHADDALRDEILTALHALRPVAAQAL